MIRVGQGLDIHAFTTGDFVMLGGVKIPHTHGLEAHSDGDVILHALCDALLGALSLGDIGHFYPPSDPQYRGRDSQFFLQDVYQKIKEHGYILANADITLIGESPRIKPYREAICKAIAQTMSVLPSQISIKATTTEKLGFLGRQEGLAAQAIVLLCQHNDNHNQKDEQ